MSTPRAVSGVVFADEFVPTGIERANADPAFGAYREGFPLLRAGYELV
jgi:hypothetical protein